MAEPLFARGRVTVLGVLNTTPDSFSDGGRFVRAASRACSDAGEHEELLLGAAVEVALELARSGADAIDVGGESTRPGARQVPAAVEIARTAPVIAALAKRSSVPVAIDTRKASVAEAALDAGASIVNDVSGGAFDPALLGVAARRGVWLVLGHARGTPETMQRDPRFDDPLQDVGDELAAAIERALAAGVARERIVADPGIGFGKRLQDNLALLANVGRLGLRLGVPVMVGPSRKSFLGALTGDGPGERDAATVAACATAVFAGADALRVHDVPSGVRAAQVGLALRRARADGVAP